MLKTFIQHAQKLGIPWNTFEKPALLSRHQSKFIYQQQRQNSDDKDEENTAAILYGIEDLRLEPRKRLKLGTYDVEIAMDTVGICGSDVHYFVKGRIGQFIVKKPMVIGHEGSGVVCKVGKLVRNLKEGDRVAIEPGVPCHRCNYCMGGKYNLCPQMRFAATPPVDGNLIQFYKHSAAFCFKLPDHVTMEEGALLEPLAVGVAACRRVKLKAGSNLLIIGAGPIGLTTLIAAKFLGARNILVIDLLENRLKFAKALGATATIPIKSSEEAVGIAKKIRSLIGSKATNTVDCVGSATSVQTAIYSTAAGGTVALVGMADETVKIPMMDALANEIDLKGVFRYCNDYPMALAIASNKNSNLQMLVTHHYDLEDTVEAFETARCAENNNAIKVQIHVQPRDTNNPGPFD